MNSLSTFLLAILVVVVAVFDFSSANDAPNNIGYLGRGYDIMKGNPKSFEFDEGFRENVYKMELSSENKSADWRFLSPKGASIASQVTCKVSYTSRLVKSEASMQASISEDISFATDRSSASSSSSSTDVSASASGSAWGVSFSASYSYSGQRAQSARYGSKFSQSSSYQAMQESLSSRQSVFTVSEASCTVYQGSLHRYNRPEFTKEFIAAVESLPTKYQGNEGIFKNFIDAFGTHVTTKVLFGAKTGVWTQLSKSAVSAMESKGYSVEKAASETAERESSKSDSHSASVSASGWGFSGSVSASHSKSSSSSSSSKTDSSSASDSQSASSQAFENASEQSFIYSIGSRPGDSPESWAKESALDPLPIKYELQEITEIVHQVDPKKSRALSIALFSNCPNKCSAPSQETGDWYIQEHEANHSGVRSTTAVCSAGGHLLGGGFQYSTSMGRAMSKNHFSLDYRVQLDYAFPQTDGGFSVASGLKRLGDRRDLEFLSPQSHGLCYSDSEMDIITVKKRGADQTPSQQFEEKYASKTVTCPEGYSLVSGGFVVSDTFDKHYNEVVENGPIGDSWKCGVKWGSKRRLLPSLMCFARCAKTVSEPVMCQVVKAKTHSLRKYNSHTHIVSSTASCPPQLMAVGGGWLMGKDPSITDVVASFPWKSTYADRRGYLGPQSYVTEFGVNAQYSNKYKPRAVAVCCDVELESFETDLTQENSKKQRATVKEGGKVSSSTSISIYSSQNFKGTRKTIAGSTNDVPLSAISSLYVPTGRDVYLCTGKNFAGCTKYNAPVQDLDGFKAGSIKITDEDGRVIYANAPSSKHATLFAKCSYNGVPDFISQSLSSVSSNKNWYSAKIPSGYELVFYQKAGYKGKSYRITGSQSCFHSKMKAALGGAPGSVLFRRPPTRSQSAPSRGSVTLYQHCNYGGSSMKSSHSKTYVGNHMNDQISSFRLSPGFQVRLYEHSNYRGSSRLYRGSVSCLTSHGQNDKISSFKLERIRAASNVDFYHECGYSGNKVRHTRSEPNLRNNDKTYSSIRIPQGWKVVAYDQPNYKGQSTTFYSSVNCLRDYGWDNRISSVKILYDIEN